MIHSSPRAPHEWKYAHFLPIPNGKIISMGEGNTTLLRSAHRSNLHFKLEYENPTGSFKDRGSTVEISHALADGYKHVVCASTGNMGASVAAYAARANMHATIVVPSHVPLTKLTQIRAYGAKLLQVKGTYTDALKKTWEMAERDDSLALTGDYPLRMEGQKTIGFELVDQLNKEKIESVICPIGNGTLIVALHAAFTQLVEENQLKKLPRLIGVQAANCAPLADAWKKKTLQFVPVKHPRTIAGAIECGTPVYGVETLLAVNASNGKIVKVSDKEIARARMDLARKEGLYTENAGAAVYAAVQDSSLKGTTCAILGGHGLKEPVA